MIERLTDPATSAFALLYRPRLGGREQVDVLIGRAASVASLADLPLPDGTSAPDSAPRHDLLVVIPYRQICERGFSCVDDGTPMVAMTVTEQCQMPLGEVIGSLPDRPLVLAGAHFDLEDSAYADLVGKILADEIGRGAGSNFVIKRSFLADIENFSTAAALTIFRRLLNLELGSYWTFIVHTGTRTLVGATPERHVSLVDGLASMNPVSGTYRYPATGPSITELLEFLADQKETDELYMVVDEELKMMAQVCKNGGRVVGPFLKEMAKLAHTEYVIEGRSALDVRQILHETMFAPPVVGSPLENACRVIARYEPSGRGYYSGILALIGRDSAGSRTLDSGIIIRTADISNTGQMRIDVGATLVRHSDPRAEAAETTGKAAGLLATFHTTPARNKEPTPGSEQSLTSSFRLSAHAAVRGALARRNSRLARFWLDSDYAAQCFIPDFSGYQALVIDAEDNFTAMLGHQLRALGLDVTIQGYDAVASTKESDLVVVGPGPGDPTDATDAKIARLHAITQDLVRRRVPLLGLCLGHQVLADLLGFALRRKKIPNQGVQHEIVLSGIPQRVGFYNTFAAFSDRDNMECVGVGTIKVNRDGQTGEVRALRGPHFSSFQFHPESVLTENGIAILGDEVTALLYPTCRTGRGKRTTRPAS